MDTIKWWTQTSRECTLQYTAGLDLPTMLLFVPNYKIRFSARDAEVVDGVLEIGGEFETIKFKKSFDRCVRRQGCLGRSLKEGG